MDFHINKIYFDFFQKESRYYIMQGGRRSGKTFAILQQLILKCCQNKGTKVLILTPTYSRLATTIWLDVEFILRGFAGVSMKTSPFSISFFNKSKIFFSSADRLDEGQGVSSIDYLFINEAEKITEKTARSFFYSCKGSIFLDYNPYKRFWVETLIYKDNYLETTFKDNKFLDKNIIEEFHTLQAKALLPTASMLDIYKYEVEFLGKFSSKGGGRVFSNVSCINPQVYDEVEGFVIYGTDWGDKDATRDADVLVECKIVGNDLYLQSLFFSNNKGDKEIADVIDSKCLPNAEIIFETATRGRGRALAIKSLCSQNMQWRPSVKGAGSRMIGIQRILSFDNIYIKQTDSPLRNELDNLFFATTDNGELYLPDGNDHCIDACRYAISFYLRKYANK